MKAKSLALAAASLVVLAACGSDGEPSRAQSTPSPQATQPTRLPAIVVERPGIGDEVSSPVTISGTANVFEATVSLRILDAAGNEIFRGFTTATCGSGCRGDFSEEVSFEVSERQEGTIEAFEESAEDGSPLHLVSIPVTLVP